MSVCRLFTLQRKPKRGARVGHGHSWSKRNFLIFGSSKTRVRTLPRDKYHTFEYRSFFSLRLFHDKILRKFCYFTLFRIEFTLSTNSCKTALNCLFTTHTSCINLFSFFITIVAHGGQCNEFPVHPEGGCFMLFRTPASLAYLLHYMRYKKFPP